MVLVLNINQSESLLCSLLGLLLSRMAAPTESRVCCLHLVNEEKSDVSGLTLAKYNKICETIEQWKDLECKEGEIAKELVERGKCQE